MKKISTLLLVAAMCLSIVGCSSNKAFTIGETEFQKEEVEKVKSILVATSDYMDESYLADSKDSSDYEQKLNELVVSYMIDNEVVYQKAQGENIAVTDDEVNSRYDQIKALLDVNTTYKKSLDEAGVDEAYLKESIKKDLVISKYRDKFKEGITVTDDEIQKYYNEKSEFKTDFVEASHILISTVDENGAPVDNAKKEELKAKADDILAKVKAGEDFATLAKENSDDQSTGKNGGTLGYFSKEDKIVEFSKEAFKLNVGDVSEVFETVYGYEIVKVTNKKTEQKSLEDVKDQIIQEILAQKYLEHVATLRDNMEIKRY